MSGWGKMKISISLYFTNTENFVSAQGGITPHDWWVLLSLSRHSVVGWNCAERVDSSSYMDLHLFMFRIKFYYFLHLSLWKESMQLNVTYLDSALICVRTLLFARERDRSKDTEINLGNLSSDFYYYCCPEAVLQDNSQPDLTQVPKQPCNSHSLQFSVSDQGCDIICSSAVWKHPYLLGYSVKLEIMTTSIPISIRRFIYQIMQR